MFGSLKNFKDREIAGQTVRAVDQAYSSGMWFKATIFDDAERRIVRVTVTDLEANVPYSQDVTISQSAFWDTSCHGVRLGEVTLSFQKQMP